MEKLLHNSVMAAQRYYNSPMDGEAARNLEDKLENLNDTISDSNGAHRLRVGNIQLAEMLSLTSHLLPATTTSLSLRIKLQAFLNYLAWFNIPVRGFMAGEMQMCNTTYELLKLSLRTEGGSPRSLVQSLKLMQILTYESCVVLGSSWTNDLIGFLVSEICRPNETQWMPHCLGILNNLCTNIPYIRDQIKRNESVNTLYRRLVGFLSHQSTSVVISCLSLISHLEEKLRNTIFASRNLVQTFQCLFNVLVQGDKFMARHTAVDLMRRLVAPDTPPESSTAADLTTGIGRFRSSSSSSSITIVTLNSFGQALLDFKGLDRSLEQVSALLVELEDRDKKEQLLKVYDLLLTFCSMEGLKQRTCGAIMNSQPINPHTLTTPILAMVQQTTTPMEDEGSLPQLPIKATTLLQLVLEAVINSGHRIQDYAPPDKLLQLIELSVKTSVETGHGLVQYQCRRIVEGLKLAEVISQDEEMRNDLVDNVSAPLCAHIAEFQMLSNPVSFKGGTTHKGSQSSLSSKDALPIWSASGVEILLELMRLLAALKDHSYPHKQQYWKLLKDERMLPFLAYGITSGKKEVVHGSLQLILHCSQVHQFPILWLSELIAWHSTFSGGGVNEGATTSSMTSSSEVGNGHVGIPLITNGLSSTHTTHTMDEEAVDELIDKMRNKMELQDPRLSQIVAVYERKISSLQSKERQLEELLETKQGLLQQHERLINQYRSQRGEGEHELSKLRTLIRDSEAVSEENKSKMTVLQEERNTLRTHLDTAERTILTKKHEIDTLNAHVEESQAKVGNLMKALEVSKREIESEREMQDMLRKRYNDMKNNFDTASQKLFDTEEEVKRMRNQLGEKEKHNAKLETSIANKETALSTMEKTIHSHMDSIKRMEEDKRNLLKQLEDKNGKISKMDNELKEQRKLIEMIQKMTQHQK